MTPRGAVDERHTAIQWFSTGGLVLVVMLALWWLVAETNDEGSHDAELLPMFALIPLSIGIYHWVRSRSIPG